MDVDRLNELVWCALSSETYNYTCDPTNITQWSTTQLYGNVILRAANTPAVTQNLYRSQKRWLWRGAQCMRNADLEPTNWATYYFRQAINDYQWDSPYEYGVALGNLA